MNRHRLVLWLAQGFGVGRIPFAPGTFGTLAGFIWLELLLWPGNVTFFVAGLLTGFAIAVWSSGEAEKLLSQTDPPSVIIDEITAVPSCFLVWLFALHHRVPPLWLCGLVFVTFRFFDIAKPWPIRQSQKLPRGWGITVDDFLAAAYVNLVTLVAIRVWP